MLVGTENWECFCVGCYAGQCSRDLLLPGVWICCVAKGRGEGGDGSLI